MAKSTLADVSDIVGDLLGDLNKAATSSKAYLQGDHAEHTWGVPIPYLAFQWVIGGSAILPCQRYFGLSGEEKSFKSTLGIEIGNWHILNEGVHILLDTENKTSPTMLDAMTWWNGVADLNRRLFKVCGSIREWQTMITKAVENARRTGNRPPGSRIPLFIEVDSLMARSTEEADANLRKEGHAAERGFPVSSLQVTNWLEALNLLGTTCSVGWVQHMKEAMDQTGYGKVYKEKGAKAAQFACSTHLRVQKTASPFRYEKYPSAPFEGYPVEGYDIWIRTARSCVGPGARSLNTRLCWQYVADLDEDGNQRLDDDGNPLPPRQVMWYDWHWALGELLINMKYNDKFKPKVYKEGKAALEQALPFVQKAKDKINCPDLGLEEASTYEFGKAIHDNPEIRTRVSNFLQIQRFPSVQTANIDFSAGDLAQKKKKK